MTGDSKIFGTCGHILLIELGTADKKYMDENLCAERGRTEVGEL
jgi:hypothetical protein